MEKLLVRLSRQTKSIVINCSDTIHIIPMEKIVRCKSDGNYTLLYLSEGNKLTVARTLKEFETLLIGYNFFRIHQSHLINLSYLRSYDKKNKKVILNDNTPLPLSGRNYEKFIRIIQTL